MIEFRGSRQEVTLQDAGAPCHHRVLRGGGGQSPGDMWGTEQRSAGRPGGFGEAGGGALSWSGRPAALGAGEGMSPAGARAPPGLCVPPLASGRSDRGTCVTLGPQGRSSASPAAGAGARCHRRGSETRRGAGVGLRGIVAAGGRCWLPAHPLSPPPRLRGGAERQWKQGPFREGSPGQQPPPRALERPSGPGAKAGAQVPVHLRWVRLGSGGGRPGRAWRSSCGGGAGRRSSPAGCVAPAHTEPSEPGRSVPPMGLPVPEWKGLSLPPGGGQQGPRQRPEAPPGPQSWASWASRCRQWEGAERAPGRGPTGSCGTRAEGEGGRTGPGGGPGAPPPRDARPSPRPVLPPPAPKPPSGAGPDGFPRDVLTWQN